MSQPGDIQIRVVEADGIAYDTDVLVLKHAQALYGLDGEVARRVGVDTNHLPARDDFIVIHDPDRLGARAVVFVGVSSIWDFTYADVRRFAYRALLSVADAIPDASNVALTLHGVGFGLDERECFEAEVAGILDAIERRDAPRRLSRVDVLEIDSARAARMRDRLTSLLGANPTLTAAGLSEQPQEVERLRDVAKPDADKRHALVAMPFDPSFEMLFHYPLTNAIHSSGLLCERVDKKAFTGDVMERVKERIQTAKLVVADLTGNNANVFLEVGFAWGSNVPTVLVCHTESGELPFDVQGQKCLYYDSGPDLETKLSAELAGIVGSG